MWQRRREAIASNGDALREELGGLSPRDASAIWLPLSEAEETKTALPAMLERTVDIDLLKGHEETRPDHLQKLSDEIRRDGVLRRPIVADLRTKVILDGHHRVNALRALGCSKTPVYFVDYSSPVIEVLPWREGEYVTKAMVLKAGVEGPKLPPKTTRHMVRTANSFCHITAIERELNIPLDELRPTDHQRKSRG
ncbi:MAG: ParB N-terminal domain-containing protein [Candidatus Bathyarchaeia archaeon]